MGSNKTMTQEEIEIQMKDFIDSGLTLKEYAEKENLNYSTFRSRVQTWKAKNGIPIERQGFVRSSNPKPIESKSEGTETTILEKVEIKENQPSESKDSKPMKKESPIPKKWFEGEYHRFGIQISNDDFYLLQTFASLSGMTMQEITIQALKEYFGKPSRKELVEQANTYSKIIQNNLKKK